MAKFRADDYLEVIEVSEHTYKRDPESDGFQKFNDRNGNILNLVCALLKRDHGVEIKATHLHQGQLWRNGNTIYLQYTKAGMGNQGISFEADPTVFALLEL